MFQRNKFLSNQKIFIEKKKIELNQLKKNNKEKF